MVNHQAPKLEILEALGDLQGKAATLAMMGADPAIPPELRTLSNVLRHLISDHLTIRLSDYLTICPPDYLTI